MRRVWQKVKESERMRGDKERTGVGKAFMLKRNLTKLTARLLKRDEWVGGWGQRVGKVPAFSCHTSQEDVGGLSGAPKVYSLGMSPALLHRCLLPPSDLYAEGEVSPPRKTPTARLCPSTEAVDPFHQFRVPHCQNGQRTLLEDSV